MYWIKDPKASLAFYTGVLGMYLLKKLDFPEMKFSLYFLGFVDASKIPDDETERTRWCFQQVCVISTYLPTYLVLYKFVKKNTVTIRQERHKMSNWSSLVKIWYVCSQGFKANFLLFWVFHMFLYLETIGVSEIIFWWLSFEKNIF